MDSPHRPIKPGEADSLGQWNHPRPQLVRDRWTSLNGEWDFSIDREALWQKPSDVPWTRVILVPFAPEAPASGIGDTSFFRVTWYRRRIRVPEMAPDDRLHLHFGAVDYQATVWGNGLPLVTHCGGYTPFTVDLTPLCGTPEIDITVRAEDDPHDLTKPRGKQDWQLEPHSIWYPRTSGIWQTVWLESLPSTYISSVRWTPNLERWEIGVDLRTRGDRSDGLHIRLRLHTTPTGTIADDSYAVISGEVHRKIVLSDPGIDDYRNELLWSPESPTLIHAALDLTDETGAVMDRVCQLHSTAVDRYPA